MIALISAAQAHARDELEAIVKKDKLSPADIATIETVVKQRVAKLDDEKLSPKQIREARDLLISTARVSKATPAGLEAYARACSGKLIDKVASDKLGVGLEVAQVLVELNHASAVDALSTALQSPHAAVRYRAATGLQALQKSYAADRAACRALLASLGRAGASETNDVVLRAFYECIDIKRQVPTFQDGDNAASALIDIFSSRLDQLAAGSRDEWKDVAGYEAAGRCFSDATDARKKELVRSLVGFLENHVARYSNEDTMAEYIPTLSETTRALEKALQSILQTANLNAPSVSVADKMSVRRTAATQKAIRDAFAEWQTVVGRSPWPLQ